MHQGQVAQLVEQGIENPRVGGSIPSLATTSLLLTAALAMACGGDDCESLCTQVAQRLGTCVREWPTGWEEVEARGFADFRNSCVNRWAEVRTDLEPRELNDALEQCEASREALSRMARSQSTCDQLRTLYVIPDG